MGGVAFRNLSMDFMSRILCDGEGGDVWMGVIIMFLAMISLILVQRVWTRRQLSRVMEQIFLTRYVVGLREMEEDFEGRYGRGMPVVLERFYEAVLPGLGEDELVYEYSGEGEEDGMLVFLPQVEHNFGVLDRSGLVDVSVLESKSCAPLAVDERGGIVVFEVSGAEVYVVDVEDDEGEDEEGGKGGELRKLAENLGVFLEGVRRVEVAHEDTNEEKQGG